MAIGATVLTSAYDASDASSYATASVSPAADSLLLVLSFSSHGTLVPPAVSLSGLSLTWNEGSTDAAYGASTPVRRLHYSWAAVGGSPGSGALTLTLTGNTPATACGWTVIEITGADNTAPIVQAVKSPATDGGDSAATSGSITLASAGHADNRPFAIFGVRANEAHTPRANWTELSDTPGASPSTGLSTQWRSDAFETTASASWSSSARWGGIALEVKASVGGPPQNVNVGQTNETDTSQAPGKRKSRPLGLAW